MGRTCARKDLRESKAPVDQVLAIQVGIRSSSHIGITQVYHETKPSELSQKIRMCTRLLNTHLASVRVCYFKYVVVTFEQKVFARLQLHNIASVTALNILQIFDTTKDKISIMTTPYQGYRNIWKIT